VPRKGSGERRPLAVYSLESETTQTGISCRPIFSANNFELCSEQPRSRMEKILIAIFLIWVAIGVAD